MLTAARHSADQHTKQPCAGKSSEEERRWLGPWVQCRFRKYSSNWLCKCFIRGRKCGRHVGQTSGLQTPVREPGSKHERSLPGRLRGSLERHGDAARLKFTSPSALSVRVRLFAHRLASLAFLCNLEHEWTNKPNALTMGIHFCFSEKKNRGMWKACLATELNWLTMCVVCCFGSVVRCALPSVCLWD